MSESPEDQHQDEEAATAYGAVPEGVTPERDQAKAPPELVPDEPGDPPSEDEDRIVTLASLA